MAIKSSGSIDVDCSSPTQTGDGKTCRLHNNQPIEITTDFGGGRQGVLPRRGAFDIDRL